MNADFPGDDLGPLEPGIDQLIAILTSGPAPDDLAGEHDALAMFRASRAASQPTAENSTVAASTATPPAPQVTAQQTADQPSPASPAGPRVVPLAQRLRRRAWVSGVAGLAAAAALVIAAYSAALPSPVQHAAYRALGFVGVPDSGPRSPGSSPASPGGGGNEPAPGSRHPSGSAASGPGGSGGAVAPSPGQSPTHSPKPGQSHSPKPGSKPTPSTSGSQKPPSSSPAPSPSTPTTPPPVPAQLTINAAQAKITAGSSDLFSGLLTDASGVPVPSREVDLEEHTPGTPGWLPAGRATTDTTGTASFTVPALATNAAFRLIGPNSTASGPVHVTVIPTVLLTIGPGPGPHRDVLAVTSPLAGPGDTVILQARSAGVWHTVRQEPLAGGTATFTVKLQKKQRPYRVLLPHTRTHGQSVSNPVVAPPNP